MRYRFHTLDVFTDRPFGGNQLAVFPDAAGIPGEVMQQVAREFNLSETVFVLRAESPENLRRLRIFTPAAELPFAGHPTVGTAYLLAAIGAVKLESDTTRIVLEEKVGPVPVTVRTSNGRPVFTQLTAPRAPEFGPPAPGAAELATALSLEEGDLALPPLGPEAVSCGMPFLFVPVRHRDALRRARVRRDRWDAVLGGYWAPQTFIFCRDPELPGSDLRARMFAPGLGVEEDPATGSAAAALAGYLAVRDDTRDGTLRWVVEQGFEMNRPSILEVEADKRQGKVTAIRVGGGSVLMTEGFMEIPGTPA